MIQLSSIFYYPVFIDIADRSAYSTQTPNGSYPYIYGHITE